MTIPKRLSSLALAAAFVTAAPALRADEASALAVLKSSDADLHAKAMACDELGRVGTAKAVPALAALLADEKLSDYARDGLERIPDPAAGKALLGGLKKAKGKQRIGLIITLGDRREAAAVPQLAKIAARKGNAAPAALTALAQIANEEAGGAILEALANGSAESKVSAAHAALLAAQRMEKGGQKETAKKLRDAAAAAGVPTPAE
jgi:HEAT repeat protein